MAGHLSLRSEGATEIVQRMNARIARLHDMRPELIRAAEIVHEGTRQWYDSRGEGTWPELAESTIERKASAGYPEPERPLFAEGNLYESVTSLAGPYAFMVMPDDHTVVIGADWDEGGWQIPVVLSEGTENAGAGHNTRIPPRPIWPTLGSLADTFLRTEIGTIFLAALMRL